MELALKAHALLLRLLVGALRPRQHNLIASLLEILRRATCGKQSVVDGHLEELVAVREVLAESECFLENPVFVEEHLPDIAVAGAHDQYFADDIGVTFLTRSLSVGLAYLLL